MGRCKEARPLSVFRRVLRRANENVLRGDPKLASTLCSGAELFVNHLLEEFPDADPDVVFDKAHRAAKNSSRQLYTRVMRKPQR